MKRPRFRSGAILLLLAFPCIVSLFYLSAEDVVSIRVLDESGQPLPDAKVSATWSLPNSSGGSDQKCVQGTTDRDGHADLLVSHVVDLGAVKDGFYYDGKMGCHPHPRGNLGGDNVTTLTLLRKLHPSPMYVRWIRDAQGVVPEKTMGEPCDFDLLQGDWVAPKGSGKIADFTVTVAFDVRGPRDFDYRFQWRFANPGDGMILAPRQLRLRMSELRLQREGPQDGYNQIFSWSGSIGPTPPKFALLDDMKQERGRNIEDDNWYFRIRTRRNPDGSVAGGLYGKIHGRIAVGIGSSSVIRKPSDAAPSMEFEYYLNPDGSRSLEWDTAHNLALHSEVNPEP